jgi:tetratricopeptide (TPR) repeat protein
MRDMGLLVREVQEDVIKECEGAIKDALWNWARALRDQGKHAEALEKYRQLQTILPNSANLKRKIAELEQKLSKDSSD